MHQLQLKARPDRDRSQERTRLLIVSHRTTCTNIWTVLKISYSNLCHKIQIENTREYSARTRFIKGFLQMSFFHRITAVRFGKYSYNAETKCCRTVHDIDA